MNNHNLQNFKDTQEDSIMTQNNNITNQSQPKPTIHDQKNLEYLKKIQDSRKEQLEKMESEKERNKAKRLKLAELVLKQGRERVESQPIMIEDYRTKVEKAQMEKILLQKENIVPVKVSDEQKEKLKKSFDVYLEKLQLSKKQKEENEKNLKEKLEKRKEKLKQKVLGKDIGSTYEFKDDKDKVNFNFNMNMNGNLIDKHSMDDLNMADPPNLKIKEIIKDKAIEKKLRGQSSCSVMRAPLYNGLNPNSLNPRSNMPNNLININNVIEEEIDPEEKKRRKENREKMEKRNLEYIEKLKQKKDEEKKKEEEEILKKQRQKEKLQKQIVGEVKARTLEELCTPYEQKQPDEPEDKGPKRKIDWDYLNQLSHVNETTVCISDWDHFRRKYNLAEETKVFIVDPSYKDSRGPLERRGWFENPDRESPFYDLKMTVKIQDIDWPNLGKNQLANHFQKGPSLLTTKKNLCQYIENLGYYENNVNIDSFFPKCFYLGSAMEFENFVYQYKYNQCCAVIWRFVIEKQAYLDKCYEAVIVSYHALSNHLLKNHELNIDDISNSDTLLTEKEWEILMSIDDPPNRDYIAEQYYLLIARYYKSLSFKCGDNTYYKMKDSGLIRDLKLVCANEAMPEYSLDKKDYAIENLLKKCSEILDIVKNDVSFQFTINGTDNIWIMKPSDLSRGRGIQVHSEFNKILNLINEEKDVYVAQKYIEKPLIVRKRKFDIRLWVLVTDFNPLTVFAFDECYIRFALNEYDPNDHNIFAHLTNNSVAKGSEEYESYKLNEDMKGLMWTQERMREFCMEQKGGEDVFTDKTLPMMKKIITWTFMSVQDEMESSHSCKNSFEMFGFDFMVDSDFNPWLIEVNLSPDVSYSTDITKRLVQSMGEDIIKVVVDWKKAKKKDSVDTGKFKLIHKAKYHERPSNLLINNLQIECQKIKNVKKI